MAAEKVKVLKQGAVTLYGVDELEEVMREFTEENGDLVKQMRSAVSRAVNKTVQPYLWELAQNQYTASNRTLHDSTDKIRTSKATNTYGRVVRVRSNRLGIQQYRISPKVPVKQKGIPMSARFPTPKFQIKQASADKTIANSFIARMESGHIGLFERVPGYAKPKTLPSGKTVTYTKIKELISLSVSEMIRKGLKVPDENKLGIAAIREDITKQIRKNVERARKRYYKKMQEGANK